ncbi:sortase [Candidatus Parcubacteria bacterium]|nr:sortase [Candidatus Parcubacteria bacterium]
MDSNDKTDEKKKSEAAANLVRGKLNNLYDWEPNAKEEIKEVSELKTHHAKLSVHQQFLDRLSKSGHSMEKIQTAWHDYYQSLDDKGKHEVWQEFYAEHEKRRESKKTEPKVEQPHPAQPKQTVTYGYQPPKTRVSNVKEDLLNKVSQRANKSRKNSHAHSLAFGLGMGSLVIFILLFSFFNERFITPFIRPSHNVGATSIIVDPTSSGDVSAEPKIIIPKINIEAPVVYDEESIDEKSIQKALERGVVHYPITPEPGEKGNAVIVGHSSSNILNSGKYKFAFLLLKSLEDGDTFIVHKDKKRYVYKVFEKYVTSPDDLSVLDPPEDGRQAIVTLITCDPPGSSANRLIIQAEQIFPSPENNAKPSAKPSAKPAQVSSEPAKLPSNSPSLWSRLTSWL